MFEYTVFEGKIDEIGIGDAEVINTINPHSYCISMRDKDFSAALKSSDILLPDGIGIVWAMSFLYKKKLKRITGYDIFMSLMTKLNVSGGNCFFLGSSQKTLDLIKNRVKSDFPNIKVESYSPPYKTEFSLLDSEKMCKEINSFQPSLLFVGMTAPKQEKWVAKFRDELEVETTCSIGAVFDFYAGTIQRPSKFWIENGLEWLPRFLNEPKRLAKRNLISTPLFIAKVFYKKILKKIRLNSEN